MPVDLELKPFVCFCHVRLCVCLSFVCRLLLFVVLLSFVICCVVVVAADVVVVVVVVFVVVVDLCGFLMTFMFLFLSVDESQK